MKRWYLVCCLILPAQQLLSWTGIEHQGMTKSAAKAVLKLNDAKLIAAVQVPVEFSVTSNLWSTAMGGAGDAGIIGAYIGGIVDLALSADRMNINTTMSYPPQDQVMTELSLIMQCGYDPDKYEKDAAVFGDGQVIITHMYTPTGIGFADYYTEFFYDKAVAAYKAGKRLLALAYLGYAGHYLTDAALPTHDEADYLNMKNLLGQAFLHGQFEDWIEDNWETGYNFQASADSVTAAPVPVCDIAAMVRSMALESAPDYAEWLEAWGSYANSWPEDKDKLAGLVRLTIRRCVPRLAGLYIKFKSETGFK